MGKAGREPTNKVDQDAVDAQVKAAMAMCIVSEMMAGRTREQAELICYLKIRERVDAGPGEGGSPSPD